jgi:hypothetical protein
MTSDIGIKVTNETHSVREEMLWGYCGLMRYIGFELDPISD